MSADIRVTWEALAWTALLCAIAWALVVYELRIERRYERERGTVCPKCKERLCADGKRMCAECADIERAKRIKNGGRDV